MVRVAVQEPLQLFLRLLEATNAIGKISANLGVPVEAVQSLEVVRQQAAEDQTICFEDCHWGLGILDRLLIDAENVAGWVLEAGGDLWVIASDGLGDEIACRAHLPRQRAQV